MSENCKVYYEIYEGALKYLNDLMLKKNMPLIKSINDNYDKDDFVLIKDGSHYHVGVFNGIYIQIIRENVEVPKSGIELELDKKRAEQEEKRKNLEITLGVETVKDKYLKAQILKRKNYFEDFKEEFGIPVNVTMEKLFAEVPNAADTFDDYINNMEINQEAEEYLDSHDGGDGPE